MKKEEAIQVLQTALTAPFVYGAYANAINMAIEALSQPNYETDTEVRLVVTNRKKEKVILWDAYGEVEYYPIEVLSAEPTDLISRQALCEYALNQKDKAVTPNDIMRFPSASVPTKCIAQININTDEVIKRIKNEYEIDDRPARNG